MDATPTATTVDVNADLGESLGTWRLGDDEAMVGLVTSANVACGFHAGDPLTLRRTVRAAAAAGVTVGAQVAYRDLVGFGRRFIDVAPDELTADVLYQLGALEAICRAEGTAVRYVKPHGALYNAVVHHESQAAAVVAAVVAYDSSLPVLGLPGSTFLAAAADAGLRCVTEGFADRGYAADGRLVPRSEPGAVVTDPAVVAERAARMILDGRVVSVDGVEIPVSVGSLCVHGDTPGAVAIARAVRDALSARGVGVAPFA